MNRVRNLICIDFTPICANSQVKYTKSKVPILIHIINHIISIVFES